MIRKIKIKNSKNFSIVNIGTINSSTSTLSSTLTGGTSFHKNTSNYISIPTISNTISSIARLQYHNSITYPSS